jgi:hypothetical protein
MVGLVLMEPQSILTWKAKVPYAFSVKQANIASVLPKIIQIHFVIVNYV